MKVMGLFTLIPASILLAVSFFVFFVAEKAHEKRLKTYGKVVGAVAVIAALIVLSVGIYTVYTGRHPIMQMMQDCKMKWASMGGMQGGSGTCPLTHGK